MWSAIGKLEGSLINIVGGEFLQNKSCAEDKPLVKPLVVSLDAYFSDVA